MGPVRKGRPPLLGCQVMVACPGRAVLEDAGSRLDWYRWGARGVNDKYQSPIALCGRPDDSVLLAPGLLRGGLPIHGAQRCASGS
jgi:hypothetical protein